MTTYMTGEGKVFSFDGGHPMGIGHENGRYWFVVETYFRHLSAAFDRLETTLQFPLSR